MYGFVSLHSFINDKSHYQLNASLSLPLTLYKQKDRNIETKLDSCPQENIKVQIHKSN